MASEANLPNPPVELDDETAIEVLKQWASKSFGHRPELELSVLAMIRAHGADAPRIMQASKIAGKQQAELNRAVTFAKLRHPGTKNVEQPHTQSSGRGKHVLMTTVHADPDEGRFVDCPVYINLDEARFPHPEVLIKQTDFTESVPAPDSAEASSTGLV